MPATITNVDAINRIHEVRRKQLALLLLDSTVAIYRDDLVVAGSKDNEPRHVICEAISAILSKHFDMKAKLEDIKVEISCGDRQYQLSLQRCGLLDTYRVILRNPRELIQDDLFILMKKIDEYARPLIEASTEEMIALLNWSDLCVIYNEDTKDFTTTVSVKDAFGKEVCLSGGKGRKLIASWNLHIAPYLVLGNYDDAHCRKVKGLFVSPGTGKSYAIAEMLLLTYLNDPDAVIVIATPGDCLLRQLKKDFMQSLPIAIADKITLLSDKKHLTAPMLSTPGIYMLTGNNLLVQSRPENNEDLREALAKPNVSIIIDEADTVVMASERSKKIVFEGLIPLAKTNAMLCFSTATPGRFMLEIPNLYSIERDNQDKIKDRIISRIGEVRFVDSFDLYSKRRLSLIDRGVDCFLSIWAKMEVSASYRAYMDAVSTLFIRDVNDKAYKASYTITDKDSLLRWMQCNVTVPYYYQTLTHVAYMEDIINLYNPEHADLDFVNGNKTSLYSIATALRLVNPYEKAFGKNITWLHQRTLESLTDSVMNNAKLAAGMSRDNLRSMIHDNVFIAVAEDYDDGLAAMSESGLKPVAKGALARQSLYITSLDTLFAILLKKSIHDLHKLRYENEDELIQSLTGIFADHKYFDSPVTLFNQLVKPQVMRMLDQCSRAFSSDGNRRLLGDLLRHMKCLCKLCHTMYYTSQGSPIPFVREQAALIFKMLLKNNPFDLSYVSFIRHYIMRIPLDFRDAEDDQCARSVNDMNRDIDTMLSYSARTRLETIQDIMLCKMRYYEKECQKQPDKQSAFVQRTLWISCFMDHKSWFCDVSDITHYLTKYSRVTIINTRFASIQSAFCDMQNIPSGEVAFIRMHEQSMIIQKYMDKKGGRVPRKISILEYLDPYSRQSTFSIDDNDILSVGFVDELMRLGFLSNLVSNCRNVGVSYNNLLTNVAVSHNALTPHNQPQLITQLHGRVRMMYPYNVAGTVISKLPATVIGMPVSVLAQAGPIRTIVSATEKYLPIHAEAGGKSIADRVVNLCSRVTGHDGVVDWEELDIETGKIVLDEVKNIRHYNEYDGKSIKRAIKAMRKGFLKEIKKNIERYTESSMSRLVKWLILVMDRILTVIYHILPGIGLGGLKRNAKKCFEQFREVKFKCASVYPQDVCMHPLPARAALMPAILDNGKEIWRVNTALQSNSVGRGLQSLSALRTALSQGMAIPYLLPGVDDVLNHFMIRLCNLVFSGLKTSDMLHLDKQLHNSLMVAVTADIASFKKEIFIALQDKEAHQTLSRITASSATDTIGWFVRKLFQGEAFRRCLERLNTVQPEWNVHEVVTVEKLMRSFHVGISEQLILMHRAEEVRQELIKMYQSMLCTANTEEDAIYGDFCAFLNGEVSDMVTNVINVMLLHCKESLPLPERMNLILRQYCHFEDIKSLAGYAIEVIKSNKGQEFIWQPDLLLAETLKKALEDLSGERNISSRSSVAYLVEYQEATRAFGAVFDLFNSFRSTDRSLELHKIFDMKALFNAFVGHKYYEAYDFADAMKLFAGIFTNKEILKTMLVALFFYYEEDNVSRTFEGPVKHLLVGMRKSLNLDEHVDYVWGFIRDYNNMSPEAWSEKYFIDDVQVNISINDSDDESIASSIGSVPQAYILVMTALLSLATLNVSCCMRGVNNYGIPRDLADTLCEDIFYRLSANGSIADCDTSAADSIEGHEAQLLWNKRLQDNHRPRNRVITFLNRQKNQLTLMHNIVRYAHTSSDDRTIDQPVKQYFVKSGNELSLKKCQTMVLAALDDCIILFAQESKKPHQPLIELAKRLKSDASCKAALLACGKYSFDFDCLKDHQLSDATDAGAIGLQQYIWQRAVDKSKQFMDTVYLKHHVKLSEDMTVNSTPPSAMQISDLQEVLPVVEKSLQFAYDLDLD